MLFEYWPQILILSVYYSRFTSLLLYLATGIKLDIPARQDKTFGDRCITYIARMTFNAFVLYVLYEGGFFQGFL